MKLVNKLITKQYKLVIIASIYMLLVCNYAFLRELLKVYPPTFSNILFIISLFVVVLLITVSILGLLSSRWTTKPFLAFSLIIASISSYFMCSFGVVLDHLMIQNAVETDIAEASGLLNFSLFLNVFFLGLAPCYFLLKQKIEYRDVKAELRCKATVVVVSVLTASLIVGLMSSHFIPFLRNHKSIRYYVNPIFPIFSGINLSMKSFKGNKKRGTPIEVAKDARMVHSGEDEKGHRPSRELVIMIVGETARADHFQINGYKRETNPRLARIDGLVSFSDVTSCGTSTAVSVPCMFSLFKNKDFEKEKIYTHENVLDVLKKKGVNILWRDNNSSSKGVAERVSYENFKAPSEANKCEGECRDEGLLVGLDKYIQDHPEGDILIILHQMGSHGPEFFKRYPPEHEFFKPSCITGNLADCTIEEINNAYDNTIRYTDYFISKTIDFVKKYDSLFEAGVFYISDHGESLGENGIFLHGLPMMFAPKEQTHVPALIWSGANFDYSFSDIAPQKDQKFSHENVPCTLMAMFEVYTDECDFKASMMGPFQVPD